MPQAPNSLNCYYTVKLDTCPVKDSSWTKVDGLSINIENEMKEEGGNPWWRRMLVKGLKYGPITLTRPVDGQSELLVTWFTSVASKLLPGGCEICLRHTNGSDLMTWNLLNVVPTSYKVSSMQAGGTEVVTETLTFEHQGFLEGLMAAAAGAALGAVGL